MKNNMFFWMFVCLIGTSVHAQESKNPHGFPLKISLMDESLTFPNGAFLRYDFNPAIMIGTEHVLKQKPKSEWYLGSNLGFFYHKEWQTGIFLNGEFGYRRHFGRWNVHGKLGLGYLHSFTSGPVYQLEDGVLSETANTGTPTLLPSATIGLGYRIGKSPSSPVIFADMMMSAEIPFNFYTGIHQFTGLGIKFYPFSK